MKYMIGQRVILNGNEIGVVTRPERDDLQNTCSNVWVFSPSKGYSSYYAAHNVKPLPGGQF